MADILPFKLFIIYAHEDQLGLLELKAHLRPLEQRGDLVIWYDGEILPGQDWNMVIKNQLETADIILLFISKYFFNSEYIEKKELKDALQRHREGKVIIIPIIVKPCVWDAHPAIGTFQVLPKDAKPVSSWKDIDEAWENVSRGVLRIIEQRKHTFNERFNQDVLKHIETHVHRPYSLEDKELLDVKQVATDRNYKDIGHLVTQMLRTIESGSENDILTGIPSGFFDLDHLTSGWQPSDLIIIAARPGMGKSSIMLNLAINAANNFGKATAIFSLQMSSRQLMNHITSFESNIEISKLLNGRLEDYEWQILQTAIEQFLLLPIYIDDTTSINIFELRARCRQLKVEQNIQLIIIDHLQLITSGTEGNSRPNRQEEIADITRGLKNMARELNIPVIVLSELNRGVETRGGNKRPQLSDLCEVGSIDHDADLVMFIYRPEFYQILEDEMGQSLKGIAELIVAKNRYGALNTIKLKFDRFASFTNLDNSIKVIPDEILTRQFLSTKHINDDDIPF